MSMSAHHQGSGSRLRVTGLCFGAVALLYGGSFYTRDWRPALHQAGQRAAEQASLRSTKLPSGPKANAKPVEPPARVAERTIRAEPEVTGAIPKAPEPLASPLAATKTASTSERSGHSTEAPPPRSQAQSVALASGTVRHTRLHME